MPDWGAIPWAGVLVAVVATQILGFLWYGPLFGKTWMAALGKTPETMKTDPNQASMALALTGGVVASLFSSVAMAIILSLSATPDLESGVKIGLLVGVGFMAANMVSGGLYEGRPQQLTWVNVPYAVLQTTMIGAIIGGMWG